MREVDTVSPVVWPAWCYSGEVQGESDTVAGVGVRAGTPASLKGGRKRVAEPTMNGTADHANNNSVKSERLSPATADNNSSSSRSGTPSSMYPGTPPSQPDRTSSPSSTAPSHTDTLMGRNYSDFMRSLAAKYNNNNPNDYFSSSRNGYAASMDPRFSAFKPGAATPFVGLMAPLGSASSTTSPTAGHPAASTPNNAKDCADGDVKSAIPTPAEAQQALFANFGLNAFPHPSLPGGVPFLPPLVDMSSTQALLNMVRTASAQSANQLETYLKGAIKRPPDNPNNPLDLSSNAPTPSPLKKPRKHTPSLSESLYGPDALLTFPMLNALQRTTKDRLQTKRTGSVSPKPKSKLATSPSISRPSTANSCLSLCSTPGEKPCSSSADTQTVAHWTVDDVCSFVSTIDLCAEYVPNFREQRIDGSALPLLTEEHLTSALQMKLGPALKLRAVLSRRLGHCAVCMHCVHCHGAASTAPAAASSPAPTAPAPTALPRPSSTGN